MSLPSDAPISAAGSSSSPTHSDRARHPHRHSHRHPHAQEPDAEARAAADAGGAAEWTPFLWNTTDSRHKRRLGSSTGPPALPDPSTARQLNSLRHREHSFTDHRLPRWQPDAEVSECPICGVPFTFFYRKHHCRKCGRVVCAACSPHRITIPRQFIVQPPDPARSVILPISQSAAEGQSQPAAAAAAAARSALGGGTVVRLCNPCVPDPNPEPPRRYASSRERETSGQEALGRSSREEGDRARAHASSSSPGRTDAYMDARRRRERDFNIAVHHHSREAQSREVYSREVQRAHRASFTEAALPSYAAHGYGAPSSSRALPARYLSSRSSEAGSPPSYSYSQESMPAHYHHSSLPRSHPAIRAIDMNRPLPPPPSRSHPITIADRDLCPVCNQILPAHSSAGEYAQEAHIRACIERHAARRPRRPSHRSSQNSVHPPSDSLRMLTFLATEKDCVSADGVQPECTICMEEYEVGVELARLECLCKFHKSCIRGWFKRKEECPVHKVT